MGHKKRGNRSVYFRSKQAQSDHKIYGCIIREGNKFPRHYYRKKGERFYKEAGTKIQSLTAARTLNRLRHFSTENRLSSPTGEVKDLLHQETAGVVFTSGVPPARSLDRTTVLSWIEIGRRATLVAVLVMAALPRPIAWESGTLTLFRSQRR